MNKLPVVFTDEKGKLRIMLPDGTTMYGVKSVTVTDKAATYKDRFDPIPEMNIVSGCQIASNAKAAREKLYLPPSKNFSETEGIDEWLDLLHALMNRGIMEEANILGELISRFRFPICVTGFELSANPGESRQLTISFVF